MKIQLAYGKNGLEIDLPEDWGATILEPRFLSGLTDEAGAIRAALAAPIGAQPLTELVKPTDRVGIIFNDITRATPSELILTTILEQISYVPNEQILLFNALGTHRENSETELREMLGDALVDRYQIVQNNCFDRDTQVSLGVTSRGNKIWLNKALVNCDVKILTGFIEPHLFAGYSGGGKAVMPGMAGLSTVMNNHTPGAVSDPKAIWGVTEGNPIYEEIQEIALTLPRTFLVNVTLNKYQRVTGVFTGDLRQAHAEGCEFVRNTAMVAVDEPFDIIVTTNSGYPLDQNLYQAVKGMSAAAQIVRKGGAILAVSECIDGIPDHGMYSSLLKESGSPIGWIAMTKQPGFQVHDQWEVQVQTNICLQADVYLYSDHLSDKQILDAWLHPCRDILGTLEELRTYYDSPRIAVMPEGPQTVPYVKKNR
jgi:nickel-dependent lactate racemase